AGSKAATTSAKKEERNRFDIAKARWSPPPETTGDQHLTRFGRAPVARNGRCRILKAAPYMPIELSNLTVNLTLSLRGSAPKRSIRLRTYRGTCPDQSTQSVVRSCFAAQVAFGPHLPGRRVRVRNCCRFGHLSQTDGVLARQQPASGRSTFLGSCP